MMLGIGSLLCSGIYGRFSCLNTNLFPRYRLDFGLFVIVYETWYAQTDVRDNETFFTHHLCQVDDEDLCSCLYLTNLTFQF